MGNIQLSFDMRPSLLMRRMLKHAGDVSEGTRCKILAKRLVLGYNVTFYTNGLRIVDNLDIDEEEVFNSELLKLTHASILIQEAVGDKRKCYVDATKNPVEIWIHNQPVKEYIQTNKALMELNT